MGASFEKIKKENLIKAIIISAVLGVFSGLFVAGLVLLILKLCVINLSWFYFVIIGVVVAGAVGALTYLLLKPNDKKLAKKLDKDYALDERVQTMVEYSGKDDDMVVLQREQTTEILSKVQKKKPSIFDISKIVVLPVLACAIFFTAVLIPASGEEGGKYTPPVNQNVPTQNKFTLSTWQRTALNQLIDDVNGSELKENVKNGIAIVLQNLLTSLESVDTTDKMEEVVKASAVLIDGIITSVNTYAPISEELKKYDNLNINELGTGLYDCVQVYKQSIKFSDISKVNTRAEELDTLILEKLTESVRLIEEDVENLSKYTETQNYISKYRSNLNTVLTNLSEQDENISSDEMYLVCKELYDNLGFNQSGHTISSFKAAIKEYLEKYLDKMSSAARVQSYNCMMEKFVLQRLSDIFELNLVEDDEISSDDEENNGESEGGGFGSGDTHYGDDTMEVYNPDENMRVKYGTIINESYSTVKQLVAEGDASDELQKYISEFFSILLTGLDDDTNN